jgi:hypothetical protein
VIVWTPVLSGDEQRTVHDVVREHAGALASRRDDGASAPEQAMRALALAYCDEAFPGEGWGERAEALLESAVAGAHRLPASLHEGLLSIAWVVDHLSEDADQTEIDDALLEGLAVERWPGSHDLTSGLVGIGIYAGSGVPRRALLSRVLEHLEARAVRTDAGSCWHTSSAGLPRWQREIAPDGYYDTGVAHGIAGVIGLAALACEVDVDRTRAERLLRGGIGWLRSQATLDGDARYPAWIFADGEARPQSARAGWCYGDPGIAMQMFAAGRAVNEPSWCRDAVALMGEAVRRRVEALRIEDAGLCHGAIGLAHMLNRLAHGSGESALREAAVKWYRRAMEFPVGDDASFLTGTAGIVLGMIAASTSITPAWDRLLGFP